MLGGDKREFFAMNQNQNTNERKSRQRKYVLWDYPIVIAEA
jgi:hypothetical protein